MISTFSIRFFDIFWQLGSTRCRLRNAKIALERFFMGLSPIWAKEFFFLPTFQFLQFLRCFHAPIFLEFYMRILCTIIWTDFLVENIFCLWCFKSSWTRNKLIYLHILDSQNKNSSGHIFLDFSNFWFFSRISSFFNSKYFKISNDIQPSMTKIRRAATRRWGGGGVACWSPVKPQG